MFNKNQERGEKVPLYGLIDERTRAVVYQGDAYAGRFMIFAVLIDVVIRGFNLIEPLSKSNWDLLLIALIGSMISSVYQVKNKIVGNRSNNYVSVVLFMLICALIAFIATVLYLKVIQH